MLGYMNFARTILRTTFSKGSPSFSYIAIRNAGSMSPIIRNSAALFPMTGLRNMYDGIPIIAAPPKHKSWRFVKLNASFVLSLDKSFGTFTYGIGKTSFHSLSQNVSKSVDYLSDLTVFFFAFSGSGIVAFCLAASFVALAIWSEMFCGLSRFCSRAAW